MAHEPDVVVPRPRLTALRAAHPQLCGVGAPPRQPARRPALPQDGCRHLPTCAGYRAPDVVLRRRTSSWGTTARRRQRRPEAAAAAAAARDGRRNRSRSICSTLIVLRGGGRGRRRRDGFDFLFRFFIKQAFPRVLDPRSTGCCPRRALAVVGRIRPLHSRRSPQLLARVRRDARPQKPCRPPPAARRRRRGPAIWRRPRRRPSLRCFPAVTSTEGSPRADRRGRRRGVRSRRRRTSRREHLAHRRAPAAVRSARTPRTLRRRRRRRGGRGLGGEARTRHDASRGGPHLRAFPPSHSSLIPRLSTRAASTAPPPRSPPRGSTPTRARTATWHRGRRRPRRPRRARARPRPASRRRRRRRRRRGGGRGGVARRGSGGTTGGVAIADGVAGVRGGGGATVGVAGVAALAARLVVGVDARLLGFLGRLTPQSDRQ